MPVSVYSMTFSVDQSLKLKALFRLKVITHQAESEAVMERVSVAWMATVKRKGMIHAARGMAVLGSVSTKLSSYR